MPPRGDGVPPRPAMNSRVWEAHRLSDETGPAKKLDNFGCGLHGALPYDIRNDNARGITKSVIDDFDGGAHRLPVLTKIALLTLAEKAAGSRAEMARVLGIAPPRVTEMFKGGRDLSYDEAFALVGHFGLPTETGSGPRPRPTLTASEVGELEDLLSAILSKLAGRIPIDDWPKILADNVRDFLSPLKSVPSTEDIRPPTAPADNPAARQPRAPSGSAKRR